MARVRSVPRKGTDARSNGKPSVGRAHNPRPAADEASVTGPTPTGPKPPKATTLAMANALRIIAARGGVRFVPGHRTNIATRTVHRLLEAGLIERDSSDLEFFRVVTKRKAPKSARRQCEKCPWKVSTNPNEIPNGYCEKKHRALDSTISRGRMNLGSSLKMMACHETKVGKELPCVGWLAYELGPGNNLGLRLAVFRGQVDANFELDGEQHENFEDTLP